MSLRNEKAFSVSELSAILKQCFENPAFKGISVYGEVYSIKPGRFTYIDLGDKGIKETTSPLLKVARSYYYTSDVPLKDVKIGDIIEVKGDLSYYPHGSSLTFWAKELTRQASQTGKSLLKKQETLKKLDKLGYLDPKRKLPIPRFCKRIAIITAKEGAAYQDRLKTLHSRFPVSTFLYPSLVQGENAARSRVKALEKAKKGNYDAILLGRGGGSKTDLSCFDDETLALSIATSKIPIITCIGHTIDVAIADRVSSKQAITPTEGASLINPSLEDIDKERKEFRSSLDSLFVSSLHNAERALLSLSSRLDSLSPKSRIALKRQSLSVREKNLSSSFAQILSKSERKRKRLKGNLLLSRKNLLSKKQAERQGKEHLLSLYDPKMIKDKGYALLFANGKKVLGVSSLKVGERILVTYPDGSIKALIEEKEERK